MTINHIPIYKKVDDYREKKKQTISAIFSTTIIK